MTFQHGGYGCLGIGGILGAFGVHLPDHKFTPPHHDFGGGLKHFAGHGLGLPADPVHLIFGDPALATEEHGFSLAAIPVGGGVTMSVVALLAVVCIVLVIASMLVKTVAVRCSG